MTSKTRRITGLVAIGVLATAAVGLALRPGVPADGTLLVSGNIEAHESVVSFKGVQSRIVDLPFDEGQWVEAGTLLARLDAADYRQQVTIDAAAVRVRRAELASAVQGIEAARRTVLADEADRAQRVLDARRLGALWRQGVVSRDEIDRAETALKQSDAVLERDRALEVARRRDVEVARASVRSAREQLRLARILLGYTVLRAPFAGVILVRQAELGEVMLPGTPVVTLADLDHVWLRGYVQEPDLGRISWGQAATVRIDGGRSFPGRISFISAKAEFTPKSVETHAERVTLVYRIRVDVENREHALKPGMPADAVIELARAGTMPEPAAGIVARDLTKRFGATTAVDHLGFTVAPGELFGLVGPDGAGKTTTMRMLAGVMAPDAGSATVAGHDVVRDPEEVKNHISYMPQRFGLYEDLTVDENIRFYADLFGVPRREREAQAAQLLAASGMERFRGRLAGQLSGGMKQKLGLTCALVHTPRVLLLDEPTTGVDPVSRRDFWRILYELVGQGVTVLASTAYLDEAERCHRLALLHEGRLLFCDSPARLKAGMPGAVVAVATTAARDVRDALHGLPGVSSLLVVGDGVRLVVDDAGRRIPEIRDRLRATGIAGTQVAAVPPTIEDLFVAAVERERGS